MKFSGKQGNLSKNQFFLVIDTEKGIQLWSKILILLDVIFSKQAILGINCLIPMNQFPIYVYAFSHHKNLGKSYLDFMDIMLNPSDLLHEEQDLNLWVFIRTSSTILKISLRSFKIILIKSNYTQHIQKYDNILKPDAP